MTQTNNRSFMSANDRRSREESGIWNQDSGLGQG
jgi:hypothetical protein